MWQLPKNIFLQELTIAFAKRDSKFILSNVTDDIRWNILGDKVVRGKVDFAEALEQMKNEKAVQLTVYHVATHGKAGAVNGTTKLKNGKTHAFCDVYEFSNSKGTTVKKITSYIIEIE
ncbi:MAG: nuclear transport factor 2 family protein [Anaerolineae bacterium]|nr:nuclear transport factor 2 family protein [Anaerolineae bacterium]MCI0607728.1 nuclear transport factor 2 family protein [Anaerolineae bacterium]